MDKNNNYLIEYKTISTKFKELIVNSIKQIFSNSDNLLELKINNTNMLERDSNCIKSSTAIGFLIEEYIVSNLFRLVNKDINLFNVNLINITDNAGTQNSSSDLKAIFENHLFLINFKVDYSGQNNAVAAIHQLVKDYCFSDLNYVKHFLIIRIKYQFIEKRIYINSENIDSYYLEDYDINFCNFESDQRQWSKNSKASGRLKLSKSFRKKYFNKFITYKEMKEKLEDIYNKIINFR